MARLLRITYPGAVYHVTSRGNERKAVLKSKRDREKFKDRIYNDKKLGKNRKDREKNNYAKNDDLTLINLEKQGEDRPGS